MPKTIRIFLFILLLLLIGCNSEKSKSDGDSVDGAIDIGKVTSSEYNSLTAENKYRAANKLLATLFKGVEIPSFFDLSSGLFPLKVEGGDAYIDKTKTLLSTPLSNLSSHLDRIDDKYNFDTAYKPKQYPLAMLFELPLSKDFYDQWMAYILSNTILFSPAVELETTDYVDIQKVYYRLSRMIRDDLPIGDIVYEHMITQENWRRFRSPEDNTREMMEVFLARFLDEEVPKAAKTCQNWSLSDEAQGYQLLIGFNENSEPQDILDTTVTSCYEFYQAVSQHTTLLPTITKILVERFFVAHTEDQQTDIINNIIDSSPTTFRQIFNTIIFSRAYLFNNSRPKWYEETFFNIANRIHWYGYSNFFLYINRPNTAYSSISTLSRMKQDSMSYKLGRLSLPLDSLSFSYYHKSVRERLLIDRKTNPFSRDDGGWQADFINVDLKGDEFIHYLFMSVLSRKASTGELSVISEVIVDRGYDDDTDDKMQQAMIVLDYISRLSELYTFGEI
ncbi:MAG: hypothetical protein GY786_23250 [Proteobacteria bacterium]|nr:hypothetical protein [Pseudomonadota bacterium]